MGVIWTTSANQLDDPGDLVECLTFRVQIWTCFFGWGWPGSVRRTSVSWLGLKVLTFLYPGPLNCTTIIDLYVAKTL